MTLRAAGGTVEDGTSAVRRGHIETARWRCRWLQAELILSEGWGLRGYEIGRANQVHTQPRIAEAALAVHLRHGYVGVPVRNRTLGSVRFLRHIAQAIRWRKNQRRVLAIEVDP